MSERVWGIASYVLVGSGLLAAAAYVAWLCGMKSGDIASWVQAIGSIGAILGAVWVGERQAERARAQATEMDALALARRRAAYRAVAENALANLDEIQTDLKKGIISRTTFALFFSSRPLSEALEVMRAVPFHELGSPKAISGFLKLRNAVRVALKQAELAEATDSASRDEDEMFAAYLGAAVREGFAGWVEFLEGLESEQ